MPKLLAGLAAASALTLFASGAQAECFGNHNVTASAEPAQEDVAMSTFGGSLQPPAAEDGAEAAAATTACEDGENGCSSGTDQPVAN